MLIIAFSKVIQKKLQKSYIFSHVFSNHFTPTLDFHTTHTRACTLYFRVNSKLLSLLIFFLWIFKLSGRSGWKCNFENSISQPLRFFGYTKHYTCKSYELTYHWYKGREVNAKHPVHTKFKLPSSIWRGDRRGTELFQGQEEGKFSYIPF